MPFSESEDRIWSAENQKCLVLKKDGSDVKVTFAGDGGEDGKLSSSKSQLFI